MHDLWDKLIVLVQDPSVQQGVLAGLALALLLWLVKKFV